MSFMESKPTKTEGSTTLPAWLTDAAKRNALRGEQISQQPYKAYGGPNPYGMSDDSRAGFGMIRDWIGGGYGGTRNAMTDVMNAGPQAVSTEGVFDGEGIDKHMNKYTEAALNPALRKVTEAADAARQRLKSGATAAGSFGDARHGVVESNVDKNQSIAIGDTAGQFMNQAFRDAVASRTSDLNRKLGADTTTAQFAETALGRKMAGARALDDQQSSWIQQLMGAGRYQDERESLAKDFNYRQFLEGRDWDKNQLNWLQALLSGTPTDKFSTQYQTGGPSPWMSLLGGLAAGIGSKI